jgi:hypothetical protein
MKLLFAFLLLIITTAGWGQGSLGGGGGFGGSGGGQMDESLRDPSLDVPERFRKTVEQGWPVAWQNRTAILSPGDRVQYKVKLAADEVLLAVATSINFDPALEVVLNKAKVATNDDRIEGDQSSFINFRASVASEYTLNVVSYSKSAGGQFNLQFLVINRVDLGLQPPTSGQFRRLSVYRTTLEKGKTYRFALTWGYNSGFLSGIVGPSGNRSEDYDLISADGRSQRAVFTALKSGDFLLRFGESSPEAVLSRTEVPTYILGLDASQSLRLSPQGMAIVTTPVRPGVPFETRMPAALTVEHKFVRTPTESDSAPVSNGISRRIESSDGANLNWTLLFPAEGQWRRLAENNSDSAGEFTLTNSTALSRFQAGKSPNDRLGIGQAKVFMYQSRPGEISRVGVSTEGFAPTLELFSMTGQAVNRLENSRDSKVFSELYFPDGGDFLVVLRCFGNGGSGNFALDRQELPMRSLKLGESLVIPANSSIVDAAQIALEANTDYEIVYGPKRQPPFQILTNGYAETGRVNLLDRSFVTFRMEKAGVLRLWFPRSNQDQPFMIRKVPKQATAQRFST